MDDRELREVVTRIDERTATILGNQTKFEALFRRHEERDRQDFKEVHSRITELQAKQGWIFGVGSAFAFAAGGLVIWLKTLLGI